MTGYLVEIIVLSLRVSLSAVLVASALGIPAGYALAFGRFKGRTALLAVANALMGLPPVVVGLLVVWLLWRSGPLGFLGWLYTPAGMILAQTLIALPIVASLSAAAYQQLNDWVVLQVQSFPANLWQRFWLLSKEAKLGVLASVAAASGRVFAEVGAVLMVGGNIKGQTRVLTTAIVLETRKGEFTTAAWLSLVLMLLSLACAALLTWIQYRNRPQNG